LPLVLEGRPRQPLNQRVEAQRLEDSPSEFPSPDLDTIFYTTAERSLYEAANIPSRSTTSFAPHKFFACITASSCTIHDYLPLRQVYRGGFFIYLFVLAVQILATYPCLI
jgi:hypothetical protein